MSSSSSEISSVSFTDLPYQLIEKLLQTEAEEWSSVMRWRFDQIKEAFQLMFGTGILPGIAIVRGDECLGYAYYIQREQRATIGGLYFLPELHASRWPGLILDQLLNTIGSKCAVESIEGQLTFPGAEDSLRQLLKARGFSFVPRSFMRLEPLVSKKPIITTAGLSISGVDYAHIDPMALLMSFSYQEHIDNQVSNLYRSFSGCRFLLDQLILRNGCGRLQPWCSLTARMHQEIVGLLLVSSISENSYFISQCFVHPRFQKSGIGQTLLQTCINRIVDQDPAGSLALTVSVANTPAYNWYKKNGFREIIPHYSFLFSAG